MDYKQLRNSELKISRIGFGCMSLKGSQAENASLIHKAIDSGVNYFDTADIYQNGNNEIAVGKALKGHRKNVVLASKVGNQPKADGNGFNWNASKAYIIQSIDHSLKRLQTDYIDLYQLHGGTTEDPIDETIEAFEMLQKQGKVRYYGISSIRPNVIAEYVKRSSIMSVMLQYSLLDRRPEETCFELLKAQNIAVLVRGIVATGLLINKPAKEYLNYTPAQVEKAAKAIQYVSGKERSAAETAIQFGLTPDAVASAVVGIRTTEQLKDAVGAISAPWLTKNEIEKLKTSIPANVYEQHRIEAR